MEKSVVESWRREVQGSVGEECCREKCFQEVLEKRVVGK